MVDLTDTLAEGPLASEGIRFAISLLISESVVVSETWTPRVLPGGVVSETAVAHDQVTIGNVSFLTSLAEAGVAAEQWRVVRALSLLSSANATDAWTPALAPSQREQARASDALLTTTHYNLTRAESARATEGWTFADTKSWGDTGTAHEVLTYTYVAGAQVSEHAVVQDSLTPIKRVLVSINEVGREHTTLQDNYHFNDIVVERGMARIGYMSPSGNSTTWAINLRTQAITEYKDFDFNSFVSKDRKYLGANGVGLFELNGNQDVFANVLAKIGGGYFQANQMKQAGLKGVYLGVGGQGPQTQGTWLLKLIMGDGREMIYKATSNPGLMVSKVNIGKGLRANYMSWELQNFDGQDFDLDKIEFIPMMSGRRVG